MGSINTLLDNLLKIEIQLENLSKEHANTFKEYSGNDFLGQNLLAGNKLDNLVLASTHEVASQIGFYRKDIQNLSNYILFRKKFNIFSSDELSLIIDNQNITSVQKLELQNKTAGNILTVINDVRINWFKLFNNTSYETITKLIEK